MPKVTLDLGLGSNPGFDGQISGARHINCRVRALPSGSKYDRAIFPKAGLKRWDDGGSTYSGSTRGTSKLNESTLVALHGNQLVEYDSNGVSTLKSSVVGSGKVFMVRNMKTTTQICIVTSDSQAFLYENGAITQITDADLPPPNSVAFLDGYFIFSISDGRYFISSINEGSTISALDFTSAESHPDDLVRVYAFRGLLYLFGTESIEIHQNTGNSSFPFEVFQADIGFGLLAGHAVATVESKNSIAWVDKDGIVQTMAGTTPQAISNDDVVKAINDLTTSEKEDIEAFSYKDGKDEILCIQSDQFSWEWNATTGQWNESQSFGLDNWRATAHVFFQNLHVVGDRSSGKLYYIDPDADDEDTNHHVMTIHAPIIHKFSDHVRLGTLNIDLIRGTGLNSGDEHDDNPQIVMSWSKDGGRTFSNQRSRSSGRQSEREKRVRYNRNGQIGPEGRIYKLSMSAAVRRGIMNAEFDEAM